jgi:UbiA prenyltransferase family
MSWLQLLRLPTVCTALSNILCGCLITHQWRISDALRAPELWWLLSASAGLYLGGMVLNDVFDASLDARERPERPIPSGRISRRAATAGGAGLTILGVFCAGGAGTQSLWVALMIVMAVLLYNGCLKATPAAPLGMALCRFLNLLLGTSAVAWAGWSAAPVQAAIGLAVYVCGVTLFARDESGRSRTLPLSAGLLLLVSGLVWDGWVVHHHGQNPSVIRGAQMALLLLGLNLLMRGARAVTCPGPAIVQRTVGLMLLCIILRDAIVVFGMTGEAKLAAAVVMLIPPAILLRKFIPMT